MTTASKSNWEDKVELPGWGPEDWVKPGSCLADICGMESHVCGSLDCVKTLEKQHKQLTILFGNIVQEHIPSAFRSCGCKEYENDRGSSLLSVKVCEISENVREIL